MDDAALVYFILFALVAYAPIAYGIIVMLRRRDAAGYAVAVLALIAALSAGAPGAWTLPCPM